MVSADVGSFSKAAEVLYTTQSNVSKGIQNLEKEVGAELFVRQAKGITLTPKGKHVYKYACRILEDVDALADFSKGGEEEWIHISMNPSSWMADCFVEFYNLYEKEHLHWQVVTASVRRIMGRIRDYKDEIGFVYIMESQKASFRYALARNHLEFVPLMKVDVMLYPGRKQQGFTGGRITEEDLRKLRFVQSYQDEFMQDNYWTLRDGSGNELIDMDVAVVTNSDYIMERLLTESTLANISGNYLTGEKGLDITEGIPLVKENNHVVFGYLKRNQENISKWAECFVSHVKKSLGM